jgi:hypothetical protein
MLGKSERACTLGNDQGALCKFGELKDFFEISQIVVTRRIVWPNKPFFLSFFAAKPFHFPTPVQAWTIFGSAGRNKI